MEPAQKPRRRSFAPSATREPAHGLAAGGAPGQAQGGGDGEADAAAAPAAKRPAPRLAPSETAWLRGRFDADGGVLGRTVGYAAHKEATAGLVGASARWGICESASGYVPILSNCLNYQRLFKSVY